MLILHGIFKPTEMKKYKIELKFALQVLLLTTVSLLITYFNAI